MTRKPTPPAAPDPEAVRRRVNGWLAEAVGALTDIRVRAEEVAAEVARPGSPLYGHANAAAWADFAATFSHIAAEPCVVTVRPLPDPLGG